MKTVLITTEFRRIDKKHWPQYVKDFIDCPDANAIHPEAGSKVAYHRFNTEAYPRLMFIEEKDQAGNVVYVARRFFNSHEAYDHFRTLSPDEQLKKGKYLASEKEELEALMSSFNVELKQRDPLPIQMFDFEGQRDFSNTATTYVFEMEEWCKHLRNRDLEDDRKDIFDAVIRIVVDKEESEPDEYGWRTMNFAGKKEIVYRFIELDGHAYYYLFDIGAQVDRKALNSKYIDLSEERLLKQARKGYPDWILYGEFEDWKRLENDDEANLALSKEEVDVLNETPYPYFVNGLAGSGKSTILYYLFAHAYVFKHTRPMDLLFLSYSPGLTAKAKSVIKALLRKNPNYMDFELSEEEEKQLDNCFWPFKEFLSNKFLSTDEEINRFAPARHLSYDQFQRDYAQYCKLNEARAYSAAIVWSVIRTFIKGRDYRADFTIDSYKALYKTDRTVDSTDFECIYKIWSNWYRPFYENDRWDDLDLVSYVLKKLDSGFEINKYDIVYCDEAQDFTPIENILILRLSKYVDYDLNNYEKIPIAYAGDPNQTVSPTGFNWKRLKEIVDKTFTEQIGGHIRLCEKTLNNNYRSKRTIVEFANSLQYIRKCFLSDDVLQPQEQWNPQSNPLPGFFFLSRYDGEENDSLTIKAGFAKTECIITGAEGEYERKLDLDELTDDSTKLEDELLATIENKTKLYTAVSSKGLEFKAVLLYRFADQLPKSFSKILNKEDIFDESDRYELSHFFTKLYIAVSRAKEVLYIADTQENFDRFWKYFIDNQFVCDLLSAKQDAASWIEKVGGIEIGDRSEYLSRMAENFSPLDTALKIYEDAKLSQEAKDMNRAVGYFEEAGDFSMAEESRAFVMLFDKDYLHAGQKFLRLGKKEDATKAFWLGNCWNELIQHSDRAVYKFAAEFMTGRRSLIDFISIEKILDNVSFFDPTWKQIVVKIGECAKATDYSMLFVVCETLEQLVARGFVNLNPTIADLYFKNKQYEKAVRKWEDLAEATRDNRYCEDKRYFLAKESISVTESEKLYWMHRGGKAVDILNKYSDSKDAETFALDERARRIVFSLLLRPQTYSRAIEYPYFGSDKHAMLFRADRVKFIEQHVLADFSEEKFISWIERPLKDNDSDLFEIELPTSLFEKVFALPRMSDWILFMKLVDNGGYRVMRNAVNVNHIADAICSALSKKNYMSLASCFLDVVFNNPHYNVANANKYIDTLLTVFKKNEFESRDFLAASKRNRYFDACNLNGHDLDIIKDRLRSFVEAKLASFRKVKNSDYETIKLLCRIYEKTAPFVSNDEGRMSYDYESVLDFYTTIRKKVTFPDDIIRFMDIRKAVLSARYKSRQGLAKFEKSLPTMASLHEVVSTCDREDMIWLTGFVFGKKDVSEKTGVDWGYLLAKQIYAQDIHIGDFDRKDLKTRLKDNFVGYADFAIDQLMAKNRIEEYSFKIHAYLYEVFLEEADEKAKKYDSLAKSQRLVKVYSLVTYLRYRALHFYAYGSEKVFNNRSKDYNISLPISEARDRIRPIIEDRGDTTITPVKPITILSPKEDPKSPEPKRVKTEEQKSQKPRRGGKKATKSETPMTEAKKAKLDMARDLKKMGVPNETILKAAPELTLEEIEKL